MFYGPKTKPISLFLRRSLVRFTYVQMFHKALVSSCSISQIYVNTMNLLFNMLLPFATMGVMNYMIYRAMNRTHLAARRSRYTAAANGSSSNNGPSQQQQQQQGGGLSYGVPTRFYSSGRTRNGRRFALGRQTSSLLRRVNMGGEQQQPQNAAAAAGH